MPMLALLLLCAGLFGHDADVGDASLRGQILQAEAAHTGAPSAVRPQAAPTTLQLYRLRQDRVLRVGSQHLQSNSSGGAPQQAGSARFAQIWERVDGQWRMQRMVSIDEWVAQR
ncbi:MULTISPECIES: DUF4440 domain-containing protein [Stenotrophomonas]|uniref:DUF4440 domain-containing protein n=1 Tax=Stenotrophomonas TaxID=40323 RepID=UPI0018D495C9|nr:DUF4440 domain-containing protein [Stenotrophomonas sp.]MBH1508686.1 DUF4440 domain-containing protein [Stenotrophomonas maltophilia]